MPKCQFYAKISGMMTTLRKPVILCGFMASGKTTVGTLLAETLHVPFADTDDLIMADAGKSIPDIFREEGESGFRDREFAAAKKVSVMDPCVISTGGGMMTFERNGELLSRTGIVICLSRSFETSFAILRSDSTRPMVFQKTKEEIFDLYSSRMDLYQKYAAVVIENNGSKKECVEKITEYLSRKTRQNFQVPGRDA